MITSRVRQKLQDLSSQYYSRVQVIEGKAHQFVEFSQGGSHLTFTPHGISHISAVERNYDWLIPESDLIQFNATELFCLICATFFHDALMIPRRVGDEAQARQKHIERAREFLINQRDSLGLTLQEADTTAQVIRGHGVYNLEDLPSRIVLGNEVVDIRKLGASLSLADLCHADASRAPEIVFRHLELDEESAFHWRRHLQISGITRLDDTILMSALTFSEQGDLAVQEYKAGIEHQLQIVKPYFDTILNPIRRVELELRRLESPLDQTLQFHANTPEILRILIQGVYDREDVFIRELVQNSLDSCLVRRGKQMRRNLPYEPYILLTVFKDDSNNEVKAVRIDDNGVGMDISDVQDTVLWIGSSISSNTEVVTMLQETLGKNLIATFGIGLLSCFKTSNSISVNTKKENETSLRFKLTGVSDNIKPEKSDDETVGTTIVVDLLRGKDDFSVSAATKHYFRQINQVKLAVLELAWGADLLALSREEIFKIARTGAELLPPVHYFAPELGHIGLEVNGEDFSGAIWIKTSDMADIQKEEGFVDILNEGVFVTEERTQDWLPSYLRFCNAVFNFSAGAISLPAGRDRVIKDEKFREKQRVIGSKSYGIIDVLVNQTKRDLKDRDFAALVISHMYESSDPPSKEQFFKRLGDYQARIYKSDRRVKLSELAGSTVYLEYPQGRWVTDLTKLDGKQLYHKAEDFIELQASMMAQDGQLVLTAARDDSIEEPIIEADLISAYLASTNCEVVDLVETNILEGKQRSRPLPPVVRQGVGSIVKFVDVSGLPNKKAWRVGNEVWINLANPSMQKLYLILTRGNVSNQQIALVSVLFNVLAHNFDDSVRDLIVVINDEQ